MEATIDVPRSAARDAGFSTLPQVWGKTLDRRRPTVAADSADAWSPLEDAATSAATTNSSALDSVPLSVHSAVGTRVYELMRLAIEDGDPLPLNDSISGLWHFLDLHRSAKNPLLTADSDGMLVATWRISTVSMLSLRFIDRTRMQFAWTLEDKNGKVSREWGENHCEEFVSSFRYANEFLGAGK